VLSPVAASREIVELKPIEHRDLFEALAPGEESLTDGVASPLLAGAEVVGVLVCIGARPASSTTERELFRVITSVAATVLQGSFLVERLAEHEPAHALLVGLRDEVEPLGVLAARAGQLGLGLEQPHAAACFRIVSAGDHGSEPERSLELLGAELVRRLEGSVAARDGLELLALLPVARDGVDLRVVRNALRATEKRARQRLIGGLSGSVRNPRHYRQAFGEARDAIEIGRVTSGAGTVIQYEELGAQRHLWTLARSSARDPFQERLEILRDQDRDQGTQLLDTIEAYLDAYGNRERASAALHIHRNTLRQRIERIRELSGIDLEDNATIFEIQTALGILRFRELQADLPTDA
jgi:sugar diacid utilization regulator